MNTDDDFGYIDDELLTRMGEDEINNGNTDDDGGDNGHRQKRTKWGRNPRDQLVIWLL